MDFQVHKSPKKKLLNFVITHGIGLAYFIGSQQELGSRILAGEYVEGAPANDLDPGVALLTHPLDWWEGPRLRWRREEGRAALNMTV